MKWDILMNFSWQIFSQSSTQFRMMETNYALTFVKSNVCQSAQLTLLTIPIWSMFLITRNLSTVISKMIRSSINFVNNGVAVHFNNHFIS